MTHLNRILIHKTSASSFRPFSAIFPVSSAKFVSLYNSKVSGRNIPLGDGEKKLPLVLNGIKYLKFSGVSKAGIMRAPEGKSSVNKLTESQNKFGRGADFYEKVNPKYLEVVRFVTGISISPYCMGWVLVDLVERSLVTFGGEILDSEPKELRVSPLEIYYTACDVKQKIPESDLYIMEDYKYHRNRKLTEIEIHYLSMLIVLLNSGCESAERKVVLQKSSVIDFMFELRVGGERVSAHQKIQRILNDLKYERMENGEDDDGIFHLSYISNFKISNDFLKFIYNSDSPLKNACSLALLLLFSFIKVNKSQMKLT